MQETGYTRVVLVVDDDEALCEVLEEALTGAGYLAVCVADGRAGLDALGRCRPCLILLDLMMPVMNGWQFLQELGVVDSELRIPVIVCSAGNDLPALDARVRGSLRKPFGLDELIEAVHRHSTAAPGGGAPS